ncbi:MAG TPA: SxtJ family membrane protein [Desulfomonilaceae bacterium]|nr:SxtJ family membrane protein [Desulfomonilaceae bacterium]
MNIINEIREEIRAALREPSSRDLNILALLFLVIPGLIGIYLVFRKGSGAGYVWMVLAVALCLARLVRPLFRVIYDVWLGFSVVLGYFVSRVLLTIIFFIVITPTGLIMKLVGKDPMDRKWEPDASSYWTPRQEESSTDLERYKKQF